MYARVVNWEGGEADAMREAATEIGERASQGPPPGVPAIGFLLLIDPENGRSLALSVFETEEDMRQGDETLNSMSPPSDGLGTRGAKAFYEVAADYRL